MARSIKELDEITTKELKRANSQVKITGQLYYDENLKIMDANFGGKKVVCFQTAVFKKNHKGIVCHKLYCKSYNSTVIEWLYGRDIGEWITVEGTLESTSGKNYINVRAVFGFEDQGDDDDEEELPIPKSKSTKRNYQEYPDEEGEDDPEQDVDARNLREQIFDKLNDMYPMDKLPEEKKKQLFLSFINQYKNMALNPGDTPEYYEPDVKSEPEEFPDDFYPDDFRLDPHDSIPEAPVEDMPKSISEPIETEKRLREPVMNKKIQCKKIRSKKIWSKKIWSKH